MTNRYLSKREESLFAMIKPSDSSRTLDQLAEAIFTLVQRFAAVPRVNDMSSFKLLIRLFKEQCVVGLEDYEALLPWKIELNQVRSTPVG